MGGFLLTKSILLFLEGGVNCYSTKAPSAQAAAALPGASAWISDQATPKRASFKATSAESPGRAAAACADGVIAE